jgi:hypothetical protein
VSAALLAFAAAAMALLIREEPVRARPLHAEPATT